MEAELFSFYLGFNGNLNMRISLGIAWVGMWFF